VSEIEKLKVREIEIVKVSEIEIYSVSVRRKFNIFGVTNTPAYSIAELITM
jgi:hypothetical protein